MNELPPKYQMKFVKLIEKKIWDEYVSYQDVKFYIEKWHTYEENDFSNRRNFKIYTRERGNIELAKTLHYISFDVLKKIAIDLGIETPDFIQSITDFKSELQNDYSITFNVFNKALKSIYEDPDLAIGLANSALESIVKHILEDEKLNSKFNKKDTLYKLTQEILKAFLMFPNGEKSDMPVEIKNIGSSLLTINQNIENLRSKKTTLHGKTADDYIVDDSLYAFFVVNSISTVAMFLKSFYETKYKVIDVVVNEPDDLPF